MSIPPLSRAVSLSSVSSFSSASDTLLDTDVESQTISLKAIETKRTRKRFTQEQLIVLESAYHKSSHPTREEREQLAKQADMSVKSVTIWFQNKRQAERKHALNNPTERKATPPLATQPSPTQLPPNNNSSRLSPALSHSSISSPRTQSRIPVRTASGYISLDRVASRSERTPRTPTKLVRRTSFYEPRSRSPGALWESMLSSPIQPETSEKDRGPAESPSARDYLDFASSRRGSRGRCRLELACAAARVSVGNGDTAETLEPRESTLSVSLEPDDQAAIFEDDIDDASTEIVDTEMESIEDSHEAVTPDASQIMFADDPSRSGFDQLDIEGMTLERAKTPYRGVSIDISDNKTDMELISAAWALCGLSASQR